MKAERRLYVNADRSKVVDEDSPDAAYLLYGEGQEISNDDMKKYNLSKADVKAADQPAEAKADEKPAETKQVDQGDMRVENKAKK